MTYNTLERITRQAVCNTLGAKSENFDKWLVTCNFNEDIEIEDFDLGTGVELSFDPPISPFSFFSSDVVFYVSVHEGGIGDVQVFFGNSCSDPDAAECAAGAFSDEALGGWYIAEDFDSDFGLHLMIEFEFDPNTEHDLRVKITDCFFELCEPMLSNTLRSFIHYFED